MEIKCFADSNFEVKGAKCIKLEADEYFAVISPLYGSSVWRMYDNALNMDIFRWNEAVTAEEIGKTPEIWGLPTLYLPNRLDGGMLKTSDGEYKLPVNEKKINNFLHGWVHKRPHIVEKIFTDNEAAAAVTSFTFDEKDPIFAYFPLKFKLTYTFRLSANGLSHNVKLENLGAKNLPVSICTHTCINSPLDKSSDQSMLRISVPIVERCELNDRHLPTERLLPLEEYDMQYINGSMKPVLHTISNDMYTAGENVLNEKPFYGTVITDLQTGHKLCNEISKEYKFWNIWNDKGNKGYFCPEPMTAMINAPNLSLPSDITGYKELAAGEKFECSQRFFTL